ncbi:hypothetical protein [Halobacterium litoreum]|uniref:Uncharacterized protein n=1 Tax=Halobacterium litoreum TaxID=2039234 RepID=A0ABD5NGH4_9EURY|nr:hypothetical protein [Halobacterium litoreum]UHH13080.1 hypothetical protein LT972_13070 [Halobacterium litoreum]
MERSIDVSGGVLNVVFYVLQLAVFLLAVVYVAFPLDSAAKILLAFLFASLVAAMVVGAWRSTQGGEHAHTGSGDITYDPVADPGQAAKDRWEKAVRRLPGGDDDRD